MTDNNYGGPQYSSLPPEPGMTVANGSSAPLDGDGIRRSDYELKQRKRRSHKPKASGGGFLLTNTVLDESPRSRAPEDGRRRSRIPVDKWRERSSDEQTGAVPVEFSRSTPTPEFGLGIDSHDMARPNLSRAFSNRRSLTPTPREDRTDGDERLGDRPPRPPSRIPSPLTSTTPLDADSTQIVNMALNLSESRRLASRRHVSSPIPPRLTPVPDSPMPGGSLRQHLQQQRRTSRNISPKPDRPHVTDAMSGLSSPRLNSPRVNSPLQLGFEQEGSYTYNFSPSTLNRAQRAKEYLELMAQYRRLMHFLPPLADDSGSRASTSSSTQLSPATSRSPATHGELLSSEQRHSSIGRPYNPLQYIRNRKVRARERKAIDGKTQGFGDVARVAHWVDEATTWTQQATPGSSPLPRFSSAHDDWDTHTLSNIPRPVSSVAKPKRPRIEWSIDPADMLADVYWLEQGDNKSLIEDRHFSKMFPRKAENRASLNQQREMPAKPGAVQVGPDVSVTQLKGSDQLRNGATSTSVAEVESEMGFAGARDRARQKLQELRGMHHRHNSSMHTHHDLLRLRRNSLSETSDSDNDGRRRTRTGTITANGRGLLEKQLMDIMAQDVQEEQKENVGENTLPQEQPTSMASNLATPERSPQTSDREPSSNGSRPGTIARDYAKKPGPAFHASPAPPGRASLEVPGQRPAMDVDSSLPPSPDMRPSRRGTGFMPIIGMDLSPTASRRTSPSRRPLSKVKSMFRERSRDRLPSTEHQVLSDLDEKLAGSPRQSEDDVFSAVPAEKEAVSHQQEIPSRQRSRSPIRGIPTRTTGDSTKSHSRMGSFKIRSEDTAGLRNILKGGAKIDGMIRGGVSKVSDMIWKKEGEQDDENSSSSPCESDVEPSLEPVDGSRSEVERQHSPKHYLDIMPSFKAAPESHRGHDTMSDVDNDNKKSSQISEARSASSTALSPPRHRVNRFDKLPRLDVSRASSSAMPAENRERRLDDLSEASPDSGLRPKSTTVQMERPRKSSSELHNVLSTTAVVPHRQSVGSQYRANHKWSITDHSLPSKRDQISKREIARLRVLILSSGIKAMEISRRMNETRQLSSFDKGTTGFQWSEWKPFASDAHANLCVQVTDVFPTTANILCDSIDKSMESFHGSANKFTTETSPALRQRVEKLQTRVALEFIDVTTRAGDDADEVSRDIVDGQRLKAKQVMDVMDKMLQRRRRRFRWVRRAGWLAVEWTLVGLMWFLWFTFVVARIFVDTWKGLLGFIRWLLFL